MKIPRVVRSIVFGILTIPFATAASTIPAAGDCGPSGLAVWSGAGDVLVEFRVESLWKGGRLQRGRVARCSEVPRIAPVARTVQDAVAAIPLELRPQRITVHYAPNATGVAPVQDVSVDRDTGDVLLSKEARGAFEVSIWLHELAHARARPRYSGHNALEKRVLSAIEEGVADYFAAVLSGSPSIGTAGRRRRLDGPLTGRAETWLTVVWRDFDPHVLGGELAAILWRLAPRAGPLLNDTLLCLADFEASGEFAAPWPMLSKLSSTCPSRSRPLLVRAFERWAKPNPATASNDEIP